MKMKKINETKSTVSTYCLENPKGAEIGGQTMFNDLLDLRI